MDFREAARLADQNPRVYDLSTVEFRADEEDSGLVRFSGHAAVFNSIADLGFFQEMVTPGAFTKTLKERDDVRLLIDHDPSKVLARTASGTLKLAEDEIGLRAQSELDLEDPDVQGIRVKMRRGDVNQMSFGFRVIRQEWDESQDPPLRILKEVSLQDGDVSIVTYPAYTQTDAQVRDLVVLLQTVGELNAIDDLDSVFAEVRDSKNLTEDPATLLKKVKNVVDSLIDYADPGKRYTARQTQMRMKMLEIELLQRG